MWLSEQRARKSAGEALAEWGPVTVGQPPAVYLAGERRQLPLCCPGGYAWRPGVGEQVLVLKAGAEGEQPTILGRVVEAPGELAPGQVRLGAGEAYLTCGERLELTGQVWVNGESLENFIYRVAHTSSPPADPDEETE